MNADEGRMLIAVVVAGVAVFAVALLGILIIDGLLGEAAQAPGQLGDLAATVAGLLSFLLMPLGIWIWWVIVIRLYRKLSDGR